MDELKRCAAQMACILALVYFLGNITMFIVRPYIVDSLDDMYQVEKVR